MNKRQLLITISWILGAAVAGLAVIVWLGERLNGSALTPYTIFPLLGLLAFSLMWTHYILGSTRRMLGEEAAVNKTYFAVTSLIVLVLIILHPLLLIIQLNKDGFGLPPQSYLTVYAEPAMKTAIALGSLSLFIFLVFEFKKRFQKKSWWKVIEWLQVVAMFMIFYHGLTLGRELSVGWYRALWYFYGVSLLTAVIYNNWYDRRAIGGGSGRKAQ